MKVLIISRTFLLKCLGPLVYHHHKGIIWLFSFPASISLISYSCLISLASPSSTMMKRHGMVFSYSDFSGIIAGFSLSEMILAVFWLYNTFIILASVLFCPTIYRTFIVKKCWVFSKLFLHLLKWSWNIYLKAHLHDLLYALAYTCQIILAYQW